jgi:hypothetical protein
MGDYIRNERILGTSSTNGRREGDKFETRNQIPDRDGRTSK